MMGSKIRPSSFPDLEFRDLPKCVRLGSGRILWVKDGSAVKNVPDSI